MSMDGEETCLPRGTFPLGCWPTAESLCPGSGGQCQSRLPGAGPGSGHLTAGQRSWPGVDTEARVSSQVAPGALAPI